MRTCRLVALFDCAAVFLTACSTGDDGVDGYDEIVRGWPENVGNYAGN